MNFSVLNRRLFLGSISPPNELRKIFKHFALDIGWYGVLNGSILSFISIYITRLGGTPLEVGLINAIPGLVSLVLALPAGALLSRRPVSWYVFISSVLSRISYLALAIIPSILGPQGQVKIIILVTLFVATPGVITNVGFTTLLGEGSPPAWRGVLSGIRNSVFAITNVLTLLSCGWILEVVPFPLGYQIIFGMGVLGALMSSLHLYLLHHALHPAWIPMHDRTNEEKMPKKRPNVLSMIGDQVYSILSLWKLRRDILKSPYLITLILMLLFHTFQYIGIPIFPVYSVNELHLSDQTISLGIAIFYATVFIGSMIVPQLTSRLGNQKLFGSAICFFGLYPLLLIFSHSIGMYLLTNAIGGIVWALVGGAVFNYVLDKVPESDRPAHIAWYIIALNLGILVGSLTGPWLESIFGLVAVLVICSISRTLSGAAILRWG